MAMNDNIEQPPTSANDSRSLSSDSCSKAEYDHHDSSSLTTTVVHRKKSRLLSFLWIGLTGLMSLVQMVLLTGLNITTLGVFALWISTCVVTDIHDMYLLPQLYLMADIFVKPPPTEKNNHDDHNNNNDNDDIYADPAQQFDRALLEMTYFDRPCLRRRQQNGTTFDPLEFHVSTTNPIDLVIPRRKNRRSKAGGGNGGGDSDDDSAVNTVLKHGAAMFPQVVSQDLISQLRRVVQDEAQRRIVDKEADPERWGLLEEQNRDTFPISIDDHPELWQQLFQQLADPNRSRFLETIQDLLGTDDPAVNEFSVILSRRGAVAQDIHQDTNSFPYHHSTLPLHCLIIPLQTTTPNMGPTHLCPGTHVCQTEEPYSHQPNYTRIRLAQDPRVEREEHALEGKTDVEMVQAECLKWSDVCLKRPRRNLEDKDDTRDSNDDLDIIGNDTIARNDHDYSDDDEFSCDWNTGGQTMNPDGIWQKGWGGLYNQATGHFGAAHNGHLDDMDVDDDGRDDDRLALFIVLSPPPRYNTDKNKKLKLWPETRQLGYGGTDTLSWHQFGMTFSDYQYFDQRPIMYRTPLRILSSIGVLPSRGWNLLTSRSMRFAQQDHWEGSTLHEFIDRIDDLFENKYPFLDEYNIWPYPWRVKFSEAKTGDNGYMQIPLGRRRRFGLWYSYILLSINKVRHYTMHIYSRLLCINASVVLMLWVISSALRQIVRLFRRALSQTQRTSSMGLKRSSPETTGLIVTRHVRLSIIGHIILLISGWYIGRHVDNTQWARDIRYGKMYRPPVTQRRHQFDLSVEEDNEDERIEHVFRPSTLPLPQDILVTNLHYSSERLLGAYSRVLDWTHPGNAFWKEKIVQYGQYYESMPQTLQIAFCDTLISQTRTNRRFLEIDSDPFWVEIDDQTRLRMEFCHELLMRQSNPLEDSLLKEIDALKSEIWYGPWRSMTIHKSTTVDVLGSWTDKLKSNMEPSVKGNGIKTTLNRTSTNGKTGVPKKEMIKTVLQKKKMQATGHQGNFYRFLQPLSMLSVPVSVPLSPSSSGKRPNPHTQHRHEPFPGSWLQEGDHVVVDDYGKTYEGIIVACFAHSYTYEVLLLEARNGRRQYLTDVKPYMLSRTSPKNQR